MIEGSFACTMPQRKMRSLVWDAATHLGDPDLHLRPAWQGDCTFNSARSAQEKSNLYGTCVEGIRVGFGVVTWLAPA